MEKIFHCELCPITFVCAYNKKRHLKNIHGKVVNREASARCTICHKEVKAKFRLKHMQTYHRDAFNPDEFESVKKIDTRAKIQ